MLPAQPAVRPPWPEPRPLGRSPAPRGGERRDLPAISDGPRRLLAGRPHFGHQPRFPAKPVGRSPRRAIAGRSTGLLRISPRLLAPRPAEPAPRAANTAVAPLDRLSRRQAACSQRSPPFARLGRSQGLWDDHPPRAEARDATCRPFLTVPADFWQEDRISVISQGFQPSLPAPARRPAKEGRRTPRRTLAYLDRHSEASQPARQPASWFPYL